MKPKISPSMMCADIVGVDKTLHSFEKCKTDFLHIDIMDGHFVPNFTLGTDYCKRLKRLTDIPLDIHLMIYKPEDKISWFEFGSGDIVSVHIESTENMEKAISLIKQRGAKAFIVLNPETPVTAVENFLGEIDGVMIMAVNPGFAGQKMLPGIPSKIKQMREYLDSKGHSEIEIEVDGNVSFENSVLMREAGADIFVAGTSAVFRSDIPLEEAMEKFRANIGE